MNYDTVVIGAGLAGLTTACILAQAKKKTLLIASGMGAIALSSGCIDVLGYQPTHSKTPLATPLDGLADFLKEWPHHPYYILGQAAIKRGLQQFSELVNGQNSQPLHYQGQFERNHFLPSPGGAIHPTVLAPSSFISADLRCEDTLLIVGFNQLRDFYPALICDNLNNQALKTTAIAVSLDAPPPLNAKLNATPLDFATAFDQAEFRDKIITHLKSISHAYDRIAFPAVLGLNNHATAMQHLTESLGKPVCEISTLPPSVPGRRLFENLKYSFLEAGGRLIMGSKVLDGDIEGGVVQQIRFETVTRSKVVRAKHYVLATGGIFGGGLETGYGRTIHESIFNLPITTPNGEQGWFNPEFISSSGHPVSQFGVQVNQNLNPITTTGQPIATNLYIVGSLLAHTNWIHGRTGQGVAISSAAKVAQQISE